MQNFIDKISDVYIPVNKPDDAFTYPGPHPVKSEEGQAFIKLILSEANERGGTNFSLKAGENRFRVSRIPSITGDLLIFRKMPAEAWTLTQCGIKTPLRKLIMDERLNKGGLIVVSGMPGNGKSTTCSAIITERLKAFSGVCNTIEDPVEMPLHGFHGDGFCLQRELDHNETTHSALLDTLRAYPSKVNALMMIGEVRDAATASLALQSAVDGRLVIITLHASGVVETIRRIVSLSCGPGGTNHAQARELLSESLRLIIHQRIINETLRTSFLVDTQSVSSIIGNPEADFGGLKNDLTVQKGKANRGELIEPRAI